MTQADILLSHTPYNAYWAEPSTRRLVKFFIDKPDATLDAALRAVPNIPMQKGSWNWFEILKHKIKLFIFSDYINAFEASVHKINIIIIDLIYGLSSLQTKTPAPKAHEKLSPNLVLNRTRIKMLKKILVDPTISQPIDYLHQL